MSSTFAVQAKSDRPPTSAIVPGDLIAQLSNLQEGRSAVLQVVALGTAALPALANELLQGRPQSISEPRCRVVDALARLGAHDVLLDYLNGYETINDPQLRFSEDAVLSAAARSLKFDFSAEIYLALRRVGERRSTPGVLEALSLYRRQDCLHLFLSALEDDISRFAAMDGLRCYGDRAKGRLMTEALRAEPESPDLENASSLHRRRSCLRLLRELTLSSAECEQLLCLQTHRDPELAYEACAILAKSSCTKCQRAAVERLQTLLPRVDWTMRDEVLNVLKQMTTEG